MSRARTGRGTPADLAVWRQQEQALVERWNAAEARHRAAHAALALAGTDPDGSLARAATQAGSDIEALRREVARLKREFLSGKRF
ncbi:MAG: hypothetical protein ACREVQ_02260 [Burkholderiales bacterium]